VNHGTLTCGALLSSDAYTSGGLGGRAVGAAHRAQDVSLLLGWTAGCAAWGWAGRPAVPVPPAVPVLPAVSVP